LIHLIWKQKSKKGGKKDCSGRTTASFQNPKPTPTPRKIPPTLLSIPTIIVLAAILAPTFSITESCVGASTNLAGSDCLAWQKLVSDVLVRARNTDAVLKQWNKTDPCSSHGNSCTYTTPAYILQIGSKTFDFKANDAEMQQSRFADTKDLWKATGNHEMRAPNQMKGTKEKPYFYSKAIDDPWMIPGFPRLEYL
jgi:hypothetical protein